MNSMPDTGFVSAASTSRAFFGTSCGNQRWVCRGLGRNMCAHRRMRKRLVTQAGMEESFERMANKLAEEMGMGKNRSEDSGKGSGTGVQSGEEESKVEIGEGRGGMKRVKLTHGPSKQTAEIYEYGAAVTSWTKRGIENFWLSETNKWELGGKAIRGGVPICWPQFGPYGSLVQHGFARVSKWDVREHGVMDDGSVQVDFVLNNDMGGAASEWGRKFETKLTVILSNMGLETKLCVLNKDDKPIEFTAAFHNYFKIFEVSDVRVFGFEGLKYQDRMQNEKIVEPYGEVDPSGLEVTSAIDRMYFDTPNELAMFEFSQLRVVKIKKTPTLPDATLWNPYGGEGADPGWNNFMCIEPAAIQKPVVLPAGEEWVGSQLLGIE